MRFADACADFKMLERHLANKKRPINPPSDMLHPCEGNLKLLSTQEGLIGRDGTTGEEPARTSEKCYFSNKENTELQQEKFIFKTQ